MPDKVVEFLSVFVNIVVELMMWALIIRVVFSWIPTKPNKFIFLINDVTDPLLNVIKKFVPNLGMIDISPIIAFLLLDLIRYLLQMLLLNL